VLKERGKEKMVVKIIIVALILIAVIVAVKMMNDKK